MDNNKIKNWNDAEVACQEFGNNVHLVTLHTPQVGTFVIYQLEKKSDSLVSSMFNTHNAKIKPHCWQLDSVFYPLVRW